jgi:hypothetical protein
MTTTTSKRYLEVQLMVDHPRLQSAELEKLLTLPPDKHWDVGQRYKPWPSAGEQCYQFSRWALRELANSLDDLPETIAKLTQRILPIEEKFHLLPDDTNVALTLFVTETNTVFGIGIAPETIQLLARINAGIEMSLVVAPTTPPS